MSKTFVTLPGNVLRRRNNSLDGPGRDHESDPMATIRRRKERHLGKIELATILKDGDTFLDDDVEDVGVVHDRRTGRTRKVSGYIEKPEEGYLALRRGRDGMLRYASYSA